MRSRNLKPGLCLNESLGSCSIPARMLFACLPMLADRRGRLECRPRRIKAAIFPYDSDLDIDGLFAELMRFGSDFVQKYTAADGREILQITNFERHQSPHIKEAESVLPPPPPSDSSPERAPLSSGISSGQIPNLDGTPPKKAPASNSAGPGLTR